MAYICPNFCCWLMSLFETTIKKNKKKIKKKELIPFTPNELSVHLE